MVKKIVTCVSILLFTGQIMAGGFQLGIGGGYGFASGRDDLATTYTVNSNGDITDWKDVVASHGGGLKLDLNATILFNDYVGLMIAAGFSMLGGYKYEQIDPDEKLEGQVKANYLPITAGLRIQGGNGKVLPYVYVTPGIFIPIGVNEEETYKEQGFPEQTDELKYKFAPGFGISSGLGIQIQPVEMLGLRFECAPTYAFARLKEVEYTDSDGDKHTVVFKKNESDLPDDTNDTDYYHGAPMFSFSSIAAKFLIALCF